MQPTVTVIPIAVISAIALFFTKEILEGVRRYRGEQRKIKAIKMLISRECELNLWTIKSIKYIVETIRDEAELGAEFEFIFPRSGKTLFRVKRKNDDTKSGSSLTETHRELMDRYLLDAATLDKKLYAALQSAYDAVAELEHVRQSLIYFVEPEDNQDEMHLFGFVDYALGTLQEVSDGLAVLYKECTGDNLTKHRLR
ncbi:hypothetical protein P0D73_43780 [Paraburkholderia sp. RL18-101-BIB-B]|uniref:hypothetical protein n=1 Tax=Paraburkholderia sp. RL18-101-BIB-B TaxID=3031634 RepID=UPI0038BC5C60